MERTIELKRSRVIPLLFGIHDANLRYIEDQLGVTIAVHNSTVTIAGEADATQLALHLLEGAYTLLEEGFHLEVADLGFLLRMLEQGEEISPQTLLADRIPVPSKKR